MPGGEVTKEHQESSHEFNFFADRQLQNKLLQADDSLAAGVFNGPKPGNNLKTVVKPGKCDSFKFDLTEDLTGWFPDQKIVGRRPVGKGETKSTKESTFIHPWKDYNRKQQQDNFVFKHYSESKKYIEQYRAEHGCHNAGRAQSSGYQMGDREIPRRYTGQSSVPSQQPAHVQTVWNGAAAGATTPNQGALHYTQRKSEITMVNGNSSCSCSKGNQTISADPSSQANRYKLAASPYLNLRTNTIVDIRNQQDSDNSSESGDAKTPRSRISSASSVRGRPLQVKSPTKISVPSYGLTSNGRPYPIQALTMQQNNLNRGIDTPVMSPKPLDNLACVAPEKQPHFPVEKKPVEPMGVGESLQVHSLNDLLSANEAPLRGYALQKTSTPPRNHDNTGAEAEESKDATRDVWPNETAPSEAGSGGRVAVFSAQAGRDQESQTHTQMDPYTANMLRTFLRDPALSRLNQKPSPIVTPQVSPSPGTSGATPKLFSQEPPDMNTTPDSAFRVSMWNPVVSTAMKPRLELSHKEYRNAMLPATPFRRSTQEGSSSATPVQGMMVSPFNPVQKIKLSITRMEPAVSFCRTHLSPSGGKLKNTIVKEYECYTDKSKPSSSRGRRVGLLEKPVTVGEGDGAAQAVKPQSQVENGSSGDPQSDKGGDTVKRVTGGSGKGHRGGKGGNDGHHKVSQYPSNPPQLQPPLWRLTSYKTNKENFSLEHDVPEKNKGVQTQEDMTLKILHGIKMDLTRDKYIVPNGTVETGGHTVRFADEPHKNGAEERSKSKQSDKRGPALASGYKRKVRLSDRRSKKHLHEHPDLEGLTWSEKLEMLRAVNKRPKKPKPKPKKLRFIRDSDSTEHEQLYEQRRIRHLVEQARLKGAGKQFDWVYEARMRLRGIDWDSGKVKADQSLSHDSPPTSGSSDSSGPDTDDDGGAGGDTRCLHGYGVFTSGAGQSGGGRQTVPSPQRLHRSTTCYYPS